MAEGNYLGKSGEPDDRRDGDRRDRRKVDIGPPGVERRKQRRRVSDAPKPSCPFCGEQRSAVYRSGGNSWSTSDAYRRRRQCGSCGRDWPTSESLDLAQFKKELAREGKSLKDLGFDDAP